MNIHQLDHESMPPEDDGLLATHLNSSVVGPRIAAPPELVAQVRAKLQDKCQSDVQPSIQSPTPSLQTRRRWLVAATMAVVCVAALWSMRPQHAWAEVAAQMRVKPWIHLTNVHGDNQREIWLSIPREVAALKDPHVVRFQDLRQGVQHEWDAVAHKIIRTPILDQDSGQSMLTLFGAMFRGDTQVGDRFAEDRIVGQRRRNITDKGQPWVEYELELQRQQVQTTVVVRVDPQENLPVWIELRVPQVPESPAGTIRYDFHYPENGPGDIYGLGVDRSVAVEDRVPTADLARIIEILNRSRAGLDNYQAVVRQGRGFPTVVQRRGEYWRVSLGMPLERTPNDPPSEGDLNLWWRKELKKYQLQQVALCNGSHVYRFDWSGATPVAKQQTSVLPGEGHSAARFHGNARESMIELQAFPQLESTAQSTISLDPQGTGGPAGSVLLQVNFSTRERNAYRTARYWLDPQRGYVALKSELSDNPSLDEDPQASLACRKPTSEYGEFRQSPQGLWYPTVSTRKGVIAPQVEGGQGADLATTYHLDFTVELPDELFQP